MKKHLFVLLLLCMAAVLLTVGCTKPPEPQTDTTADPSVSTAIPTDTPTEGQTEDSTDGETEPETEPETRPEINLPTDPAEIVSLIDSIPNGSLENEAKIDLAYAAWGALSEADREKVTNYDTLRTRLQELADGHIVKEYTDTRIPHGKLILGVYYGLYNAEQMSDAHMQDMKDAYIDLDWAPMSLAPEFLDMYSKYGMGVVVRGGNGVPIWRAEWVVEGFGSIPGATPTESISMIPTAVGNDHPAIWAYDVGDELGSNNYWWLSEVMAALTEQYKGPQFLSNMHPSYGGPGPLGAYSYTKYVRNYARSMPGDLMSYDHYMYFTPNGGQAPYLNCLYTQYKATSDYGRDLVTILQINQGPGVSELVTEEQMKYQAYTALAFGSKYVVWANYARNWGGGWHDAALDEQGNKRDQYYFMKNTNADLVAISPIYMRYTAKGQTMINANPDTSSVQFFGIEHPLEELEQKTITDLTVAEERDVLVGFYEKNVGEGEAFILVNSSDCYFKSSYSTHVSFRTVSGASVVTAYVKGVPTILDPVDGVYTVEVKDADAVFITVTEPASINAKPAVYPVGQVTVAGKDIGEFTVVIPVNATARELQAAETLVDLIEKATGKRLPIVTDAETPAAYISLGNTTLSSAVEASRKSLTGDGYALITKDSHLYVTGADADGAGTLMGVYGLCEDYLGYRFYGEKDVVIPTAETKAIPDGLTETHNPAFLHREATFHAAVVQPYPLYQKYNGDLLYGDLGFAAEWWGGESLYRLAEVPVGSTICLSSEDVYAAVLANARQLMACDPDADYLSCALDVTGQWTACGCEACTASVTAEGTPMGLLLTFVNRLAADLRADYPDLLVETMAVGPMAAVPKTVKPSESVVIRVVLPEDACRHHALNDPACTANAELRATLEAWCKVCDKVMVLDNATARGTQNLPVGANLLTLYDTVQYLRSLGVMGYTHTGYDYLSSEMDALRNYLLSILLWDADMTREEYLAAMDGFLAHYYGNGWTYIRQYIDKIGNTEDTDHTKYKKNIQLISRTTGKDSPFIKECTELWASALEAAETDRHANNVERSTLHLYQTLLDLGGRSRDIADIYKALCGKYGFPA